MEKKKRRVRCFSCKQLVALKIDYYNPEDPYLIIPLSIDKKRGCICSRCIDEYLRKTDEEFIKGYDDLWKISPPTFSEDKAPSHPPKPPSSSENQDGHSKDIPTNPEKKDSPETNNDNSSNEDKSTSNNVLISELLKLKKKYSCLDYSLDSLSAKVKNIVFGQDEFVEKLLYTLYFNQTANLLEEYGDPSVKRKHVLLIGGTGVGKTLLATTSAKIFGIPFSISNATPITSAGYIGDKIEHVLERLYQTADKDIERAQNGIIILDEIDKKASCNESSGRDVSGLAVQQELLKLLEPSTVWIEKQTIPFDTTNLTIIMMGAFVGLDEIIKKRTNSKKIGFASKDSTFSFTELIPDDLIEYGFIPEMVGRIPLIYKLNDLSKEDMINIIYKLLAKYNLFFKSRNFDLIFSPFLVEKIAEDALESKTGARDLDSKIDKILQPALYRVFQSPPDGVCEVMEDGSINLLAKTRESNFTKSTIFHFDAIPQYIESEE